MNTLFQEFTQIFKSGKTKKGQITIEGRSAGGLNVGAN